MCLTDLDLDLGPLIIDDSVTDIPKEQQTSLPLVLYTVYGLLFHMGYLLKSKHHYLLTVMLIWSSVTMLRQNIKKNCYELPSVMPF